MAESQTALFKCHADEVRPATEWVIGCAAALGLRDRDPVRLGLAFEEMFANTLMHGGVDGAQSIEVRLALDGTELRLDYLDSGVPFDPINATDEDAGDPREGTVGGLGLKLLRWITSRMTYALEDGRNHVTLWMPLERGAGDD
ncbi:MAG: ATP-binding protein [Pseudomonadota bacterium]|nr:ATP-binding protein [Pseudomonadota bacterium]